MKLDEKHFSFLKMKMDEIHFSLLFHSLSFYFIAISFFITFHS